MAESCHPPIFCDRVLDDASLVRTLIERNAPYFPVQRYFQNEAEFRASSARMGEGQAMIVAPNFRGDWAYDEPLIDGVEPLLHHAGFTRAASTMFESACVEPFSVYSNITWQLPFAQGVGHTDVPEFRGVSRADHPTWVLSMMGRSGLFEDFRVQIATSVAWFYQGSDGGFTYWPDGPDAPPRVHEGRIFNTAITGDNDRMYHRVRPVGAREKGLLLGMTLETQLEHRGNDAWAIVEAGETLATLSWQELRISVSWKARVFADEAERDRYHEGRDGLSIDRVWDHFYDDLAGRGIAFVRSSAPERDPELVDLLSSVYAIEPSITEARTG